MFDKVRSEIDVIRKSYCPYEFTDLHGKNLCECCVMADYSSFLPCSFVYLSDELSELNRFLEALQNPKAIGENIKKLRCGQEEEDFAKDFGITPYMLKKIENGEIKLKYYQIVEMAKCSGYSIIEILGIGYAEE